MSHAADILRDPDPFAREISGFQPRESQWVMAEAVEKTLGNQGDLVVEAETGTGKTLAYLVPALLDAGPTIVSTGTRSLQDQLFIKDLPVVQKALGVQRRVALLKGRNNYLCPYRMKLHQQEGQFLTRETAEQLQTVVHWSTRTQSGDLAELQELPDDAPVWPWVTSTADNCLGQDCPDYHHCPVMKARQNAQEADLVVVNHHLFFADAALKGEGVSELLPRANAVIFDEAHQLPDTAATFFGESLSARQIRELGRDCVSEAGHTAADIRELNELTAATEKAVNDLRLAMGEEGRREPWHAIQETAAVEEAASALEKALAALSAFLEPLKDASKGMDSCERRAREQLDALRRLTAAEDPGQVYWFENFRHAFVLHATPLSVAEMFSRHRQGHQCGWIFTSATLSVAGDFTHFLRRLGLENAETLRLESPFDFRRQSVLYVPEGLPVPGQPGYTRELVAQMIPVMRAAEGRTFFLFTSHRALREAADLLREELEYPLLVQGESSRRQLLDSFREQGNAVLLGTSSFWQGIDVRGGALSCVIIDKLPFASPGDPVGAARIERIREEGGNPFRDFQLPQAVLALRQGAGRLIRDPEDTGLLVLADPRLIDKGYGKLFLDSLPGMAKTRRLDVVQRFFRVIDEAAGH